MKTEFVTRSKTALKPLALACACALACSAMLGVVATSPAAAQVSVSINLDSNIASQEWADPPGRVGRLSYLSGEVSFFGDNQEGWARGRLNYPVSNENSVWTGRGGRAEFRVGAQAVRVDEETVLDVLKLNDNATVLYLQRGVVNVRIRDFNRGDSFWIDTAEGRLAIRGNGRYRVEVDNNTGEARFTAFSGSARVEGDNIQRRLERDTTLRVGGGGNIADARYERSFETGFDRWSYNRDRDDDFAYSSVVRDRVISPYMTGYEDLNANGDWIDDNEYGRIWAPRVTIASWAPYRYGRWTYASRWGWTWVDDAPWGFAPFHYGRWLFTSNRWCWSPGSYVQRPVYAPALVGWHGGLGHGGRPDGRYDGRNDGRDPLSNALNGRGAVGWFPLSPNDRFVPSYTSNQNYVRNVNSGWVGRPVSANNAFQNNVPGATFVARDVFLNAAPITTQATISAAEIMRGGVPAASFNNTFTTAAPSLLPGRFRGASNGNAPAPVNQAVPPVFAGNSGGSGSGTSGIAAGRPSAQPQAQPQPQFQTQPQPQSQFQPQQPAGRPSAADVMRGGVSLNPAPVAQAAPVQIAPVAPAPNFGVTGGRLLPQQPQQPQTAPPAQPMPLQGRDVFNPNGQNNQGNRGGRPVQQESQAPQQPVNQPSAPVYARPGYAAPTVAPAQNAEAPTGFRRGDYGQKQQPTQAPQPAQPSKPLEPRGIYNAPQKSKAEVKAEAKAEAKAEREGRPGDGKQNDNRAPARNLLEKQ